MDEIAEIVPDELCAHIQVGAPMVGGWIFLDGLQLGRHDVGMCAECIAWCQSHFLTYQMPVRQYEAITQGRLLNP